MLASINNWLRTLFTGCMCWCFFLYVLVAQAISALFFEQTIPVAEVDLLDVSWSSRSYAAEADQQISVELEYRNRSPLQLVKIKTRFRLLDCPTRATSPSGCRLVHEENVSSSVATLPGLRGRVEESFVIYGAPHAKGKLVLRTMLITTIGKRV